jgi:drug/metabolite transporter (DMT)-like permease
MSDHMKGVLAMVIVAFAFSVTGIFARELDQGFTLYQQTYVRIGLAFFLAALIFAPYVDWAKSLRVPTREWMIVALRGVSAYTGVLLYSYAMLNANYSNVSFITVLPILPLLGYLFFRERMTPNIVGYIVVGFVGALLIVVHDWGALQFGIGEVAALLCLVFFDLAYVGRRWQSGELSNMAMATGMFLFGSMYLFLTSMLLGEALPSESLFTPWIWLMLVVAALLNVFHVTLTNYGFSKLTVTLAGTILMLESIFALGISIFLYSEIPTTVQLVGSALILFSVYKMNQLS